MNASETIAIVKAETVFTEAKAVVRDYHRYGENSDYSRKDLVAELVVLIDAFNQMKERLYASEIHSR